MKSRLGLLALVVLVVFPCNLLMAQRQRVEVDLHVPPDEQMNIERYWWLDLNNRTRETFRNVWLYGEMHEARRGLVYRAQEYMSEPNS